VSETLSKPGRPIGRIASRRTSGSAILAMSEARLEILRAGYDASNRDDYEAWIAAYDDDVAAETVGTTNAFFRRAPVRRTSLRRSEASIRCQTRWPR